MIDAPHALIYFIRGCLQPRELVVDKLLLVFAWSRMVGHLQEALPHLLKSLTCTCSTSRPTVSSALPHGKLDSVPLLRRLMAQMGRHSA